MATNFHDPLTAEDEEKLLDLLVIVAHLRGPGRHAFFNDAEIGVPHQVPAVAAVSPNIVFGITRADDR